MASQRKNRELHIDIEALATLSLVQEGILYPVTKLMCQKEAKEVDEKGIYKNKTFPFSFIFAPSGKRNKEVLQNAKKGEILDIYVNKRKKGWIRVEEIFPIDRLERVRKIFSTSDPEHPGVKDTLSRLGDYAVCGEYRVEFEDIKKVKEQIKKIKEERDIKHTTAIMMAAKPLHRGHERVMRLALEKTDLLIIFLLKPYKKDIISYELRYETLKYFTDNFFPKNRVLIVPFENTYIFAGYNNVILDSIAAENLGCDKIVIGKNHAGIGMFYDKKETKSIIDTFKGINIEIEVVNEFVYCDICKTLVSTDTCPHGQHHHISYHSEPILELLKAGVLPPAVLVRKEISAIILSKLFPNRFHKVMDKFANIFPVSAILEPQSERDFYIQLMKLHQTSSLT